MSRLDITGLSKQFGPTPALHGVGFTVAPGTRTAVVGPSGSGKTTLLRLIAGFDAPDAGEIRLDGALVAGARAMVPPHRRNIGLVMQDGVLFPHLTVMQNIAFGQPRHAAEARARALDLMDMVELDRSLAIRRPHELSGGQQQRVALARALLRQPGLMLLDEPFSSLDTGLRAQLRDSTADILGRKGVTTLLVTHDQAEAMSFADQIVVLRDGVLGQVGAPRDVYLAPRNRAVAEFLGQAIVLEATLTGGTASCALGDLRTRSRRDGPARIMLRPEQIEVHAATNGRADAAGRLISADFAGSYVDITLALDDVADNAANPLLSFRTSGPALPPVGDAVAITINGPAHVFDEAG